MLDEGKIIIKAAVGQNRQFNNKQNHIMCFKKPNKTKCETNQTNNGLI